MEFVSISNVVRILFIYSKLTPFLTIFIEQYSFNTLLYQIKIQIIFQLQQYQMLQFEINHLTCNIFSNCLNKFHFL